MLQAMEVAMAVLVAIIMVATVGTTKVTTRAEEGVMTTVVIVSVATPLN